jgi:CheY-like chemotaxis protein
MNVQQPVQSVKRRLLVIDDDDLVRATLRDILEEAGYDVLEAADGRQGLESFKRHRVDLVITDILMPEKEGIETILDLRRLSADVPIIAVSGGGATHNLEFLNYAEQFGANQVLPKPVTPSQICQAVRQALAAGPLKLAADDPASR